MSVIIQAGHQNIAENCDHGLRGETGAHGEAAYVAAIAAEVCGALKAHGVDAIGADANASCDGQITGRDYDAVISLHCDGRSRSGFAVGVGNPTEDGAAAASERLASSLRTAYAHANPSLSDLSSEFTDDANITEYYLFRVLSQATPFALIELGAIASADGELGPDQLYLMNHEGNVADGIVQAVLAFLGLPAATEPAISVTPSESTPGLTVGTSSRTSTAVHILEPDMQGPPPSYGPHNSPVPFPEVVPPPLVGAPPALVPDVAPTAAAVKSSVEAAVHQLGTSLTSIEGALRQLGESLTALEKLVV